MASGPYPSGDVNVPHEAAQAKATEDQMARTSDHAAIADLGAFTDPPSAAEMAALRGKVNEILDVLRDASLIPSA